MSGASLEIDAMTQVLTTITTHEDIEAAVARAREERADAIRAGAVSLGLIIKHFLSDRRPLARA
jgi:hypothetical protein